MTREFRLNGWHVLAIFVGAFGVIIGVNLALAWNAVATFPGLEVENSYIASQTFDDRRAAQEALGWTVDAQATDGRIVLAITNARGYPVQPRTLSAKVGRTTSARDDRTPEFTFDGRAFVADDPLARGYWNVWLTAQDWGGTTFQQRLSLHVR